MAHYVDTDGTYYENSDWREGFTEVEERPTPFHARVNGKWVMSAERWNAAADERRAAAYKAEADPLYFKQARGEVPAGTWEAKVAEIKTRFPKQPV